MNKRIRELWNQSRYPSGRGHDEEKFAELIVLECARWLGNREFASPEALKQHFGVEE